MPPSEIDVTDSQILRTANLLLERFRIRKFKPSSVSWADYMIQGRGTYTGPHVKPIPIGWCEFSWDALTLPVDLKGKLTAEEWTPLIESSLIHAVKLRSKKAFGVVGIITLALLLELLLAVAVLPLPLPVEGFAFLSGTIVLLMMGNWFVNKFRKSLRLEADRLAADHTEKDFFIDILRKIDNLRLESADFGGQWSPRPSLTERIHSLAASNVTNWCFEK